jgi:hypothetical protein
MIVKRHCTASVRTKVVYQPTILLNPLGACLVHVLLYIAPAFSWLAMGPAPDKRDNP